MTNSIKMNKIRNQWKIFFDSMNSKIINLIDSGAFILNALVYQFLGADSLSKGNKPMYWMFSCIWFVGAFMFFLRLFYNQVSLRYSKTLPCTKKLYTKYISLCFEILNSLSVIAWLILWVIYWKLGKNVSMFGIVFLFVCIIHLFLSVGIPFTALILTQENKITFNGNLQKIGTVTKLLIVMALWVGGIIGIYKIMCIFINNAEFFLSIAVVWLILICGILIAASFVCNRLLFNRIYKKTF